MSTITVYTKPACVQCNATHNTLAAIGKRLGLGDADGEGWWNTIDLAENPDAVLELKAQKLMSAPAVFVYEDGEDGPTITEKWGGFRPDKLSELENQLSGALVAA